MARECSLCGGKLRGNICTECGLDNSKCDANYKTSRSHKWNVELTHIHETNDPFAGKTMTGKQKDEMKSAIKNHRSAQQQRTMSAAQPSPGQAGAYEYGGVDASRIPGNPSARKKGKTKVGPWIGFLLIFLFVLFALFGEIFDDSYDEIYDYEDDEDYDPYGGTTYDLDETGEEYETSLTAGTYVGGVHLPEGTYCVEWISGDGGLKMESVDQQIYIDRSIYEEEIDEEEPVFEEFQVYEGARIEVEEGLKLRFYTENALFPMEELTENEDREKVTVEDQFVVGEEVEEGIYDIYCKEGSGIFNYTVESEDGYSSYEGKLIGDDSSKFPNVYKNVVLPEGVEVEIEGMKVLLVPSEYVWDVDYDTFYE